MRGRSEAASALLLLVLLAFSFAASADAAPHAASFEGPAQTTLDGDGEVRCAGRVLHAALEAGGLDILAASATWREVVVETRGFDSPVVEMPRAPRASGSDERTSVPHALQLAPHGTTPLVQVFPAAITDDPAATMDALLAPNGVRWSAGDVERIGDGHWRPSDDAPVTDPAGSGQMYTLWNGFNGAAALDVRPPGNVTLQGDLLLLLRNVSAQEGGDVVAVTAPAVAHHTDVDTLGATVHRTTWREAWLRLEDATVTVHAAHLLRCGTVSGEVDGRWARDPFQGSILLDGPSHAVADRSVALQGRFTFEETFDASGTEPPQGQVDGRFQVYGVPGLAPTPQLGRDATTTALTVAAIVMLLASLVKAAPSLLWAIHYSRLDESKLLDHPTRRLLYDHIVANPGHDLQTVAHETGVSRSVVRHHVNVLERGQVLLRQRVQGRLLLLPPQAGQDMAAMALAAREPAFRLVRDHVAEGPVPRHRLVRTLSEDLSVSRRSARRWIQRAVDAGIVETDDAASPPAIGAPPSRPCSPARPPGELP